MTPAGPSEVCPVDTPVRTIRKSGTHITRSKDESHIFLRIHVTLFLIYFTVHNIVREKSSSETNEG